METYDEIITNYVVDGLYGVNDRFGWGCSSATGVVSDERPIAPAHSLLYFDL